MIESEYKCMIDGSLYQDIINKLNLECKGKTVIQINYYYDTEDFSLDKNNITFRIRQKDEKLSMEIKCPIEKNGLLRVKNEIIYTIDRVPNCIDLGKSDLFNYLDGTCNIMLIGSLITERTSYAVKKGIKVDIDKSYYFGNVDYELEIEFEENLQKEALKLLEELTLNGKNVPDGGKRDRFINKLRQMHEYTLLTNA